MEHIKTSKSQSDPQTGIERQQNQGTLTSTQSSILQMQRLIGNARVRRMIQCTPNNDQTAQQLRQPKAASQTIQREPAPIAANQPTVDKAQAAPVLTPASSDTAAPETSSCTAALEDALKKGLIAGTYAYKGYYEADPAGKFKNFELEDLETARKHYLQWAESGASAPVLSEWEQKMEKGRIAAAKKLAEQKKLQAENRARVRDRNETNAAAKLRTGIANAEKRPNKKVLGLPNDPTAYRRMLAEGMDPDPKKRDSKKLDMYKSLMPEMDVNAAIYQTLRKQQRDLSDRRAKRAERSPDVLKSLIETADQEYSAANAAYQEALAVWLKKNPKKNFVGAEHDKVAAPRTAAKAKLDGLKGESEGYEVDMHDLLMAEFQIRSRIVSIAEQLDQPYKSLGIEGRYANQDPRSIADPKEREKAIQADPFLSKGIDVPGRFVESKEIEEDKKWIAQALAEEADKAPEGTFETGTAVDLPSGTDTATALTGDAHAQTPKVADNQDAHPEDAKSLPELAEANATAEVPTPEDPKTLHDVSVSMDKQDKTELYKTLRAETELAVNHQQMVIAGDTSGHNIVDHPQWFIKIMTKLMGLTPADPIKKVINPGPVWDSEADGAQAVLTAYLNAWTKRRLAIMHKTDGKDKEGRSEKIPTNIEVMNAAVGFSETNERAELFSGLRGEMDWCGPGTQRSVILGLWKAGLYLRTGKPPLALQHLNEIPAIAQQLRTMDAEIEQMTKEGDPKKKEALKLKKMQRRAMFWKVWGDWLRKDLTAQDSSMIADWFKEGTHQAPKPDAGSPKPDEATTPAQVDQRRQVDLPEAATAPLYPGDFVYWVSSFPYGPVAGHVATIIEEKDRVKKPNPGSTDSRVSTLHIDSANASGVRQGEGSVRMEQTERVVTNASFDYWKAAGWSNAYYYGQNPAVSRDRYNELYSAAEKRIKAEDSTLAGEELKKKVENDPTVKPMGDAIRKHKASSPFPVHKMPQTPADYLDPANRYTQEPGTIGPQKPDSVWIVSIKRTSKMMDPLKMLEAGGDKADKGYSTLKDGSQALDLAKMGERRVAVMPPGMKEAIIEIMTIGGFGRLLQGETFDEKFRAFDHLDKEDQGTVNAEKRKVAGPEDPYD